jgi:hypothetical protein
MARSIQNSTIRHLIPLRDCFGSRLDVEFPEQRIDMKFDGIGGTAEPSGGCLVADAIGSRSWRETSCVVPVFDATWPRPERGMLACASHSVDSRLALAAIK